MHIRKYQTSDIGQIIGLFYETIHSVNAKDYSEAQLNAWASGNTDWREWDRSFLAHYSIVAVKRNVIVGFGDIDKTGYLVRLYVHKDHQRQGIATAICGALEQAVNVAKITTHASITAVPFFTRKGYQVIKEQRVIRAGIALINYVMEK